MGKSMELLKVVKWCCLHQMILPTLRFENVFIAMIPSPKNVSLATKIMAVGQLDVYRNMLKVVQSGNPA